MQLFLLDLLRIAPRCPSGNADYCATGDCPLCGAGPRKPQDTVPDFWRRTGR